MGRIVTELTITNPLEPERSRRLTALVDTGATFLCLPLPIIQELRLGERGSARAKIADGRIITAMKYGPAFVEIAGLGSADVSVMALPADASPLLGYTALEEMLLVVDMVGHRLLAVDAEIYKV